MSGGTHACSHRAATAVAYGTLTRSGRPFQWRSADRGCSLGEGSAAPSDAAVQPRTGSAGRLVTPTRFGLLPFRSPLLRESSLFLGVLRCFSSPGAPRGYASAPVSRHRRGGLPHSDTPGSPRASALPRAFRRVAASFIGRRRQGIHRALIIADRAPPSVAAPRSGATPLPPTMRPPPDDRASVSALAGDAVVVPSAARAAMAPRVRRLSRCAGGAAGIRTPDLRRARAALSRLSYDPIAPPGRRVGAPGLEPGTSALSGPRSNHLSYAPAPRHHGARTLRRRRSVERCADRGPPVGRHSASTRALPAAGVAAAGASLPARPPPAADPRLAPDALTWIALTVDLRIDSLERR